MSAPTATQSPLPGMPMIGVIRGRTIVGLILGPNSSIRRFVGRIQGAVEDVSAICSESRPLDLQRDDELDAALLDIDRGNRLGARDHIVAAKALDARVDPLIWGCDRQSAWSISRYLAGYLERALKSRAAERRGGTK